MDLIDDDFSFDIFIKYYNQELLEFDEKDFEICRRFSSFVSDKYEGINLNLPKLYKMFSSSIEPLGDKTKRFYQESPKIKRTSFENGYAEIIGNSKDQIIYLTRNRLKDIDFIAFSHEMGHIPILKKGGNYDYFEYSETLSIFFEYLASIYLDKDNVYSLFLKNRLDVGAEESLFFLEASENIKDDNSQDDYDLLINMRESYKYIISLEYALNLIELYNTDKKTFNNYLDEIVVGKSSFKELEKDLNLDIKSYKMLRKHI